MTTRIGGEGAMRTLLKWGKGFFHAGFVCGVLFWGSVHAAETIEEGLKKGLIEEEANRNFGAAIAQYEKVVKQVDAQRQVAATAVFRLGETYRKMGRTNDAVQAYQRVLTEFASEEMLGMLSRQNLSALGFAPSGNRAGETGDGPGRVENGGGVSEATRAELGKLFAAELILLSKQEDDYKKAIAAGLMGQDEPGLLKVRRDILELKRKLVEVNDRNFKPQGLGGAADEVGDAETREIRRLEKVLALSPDLLNAPDGENKTTPLEAAASRGQLKVVDYLLGQPGLDKSVTGNGNLSALHWAALHGHKSVVERLIAAGFGVDSLTKKGSQTPLHLAVARGHRLIVESLLKLGANVRRITAAAGADLSAVGVTPLGLAISMSRKDLYSILIEAGGYDPKLEGQLSSPLRMAVYKEDAEAVRLLLKHRGVEDVQFRTAWILAARNGEPELVRLFLGVGAAPESTDGGPGGTYPLMEAVGVADPETVGVLLEAKADPNWVSPEMKANPNGWFTPLTSALNENFWQNHGNQRRSPENAAKVVKLLLEAGADPNLQDGSGQWPLNLIMRAPMEAVMKKTLLELLLKHGGDPTRWIADSGMSLLHVLAQDNDPEFLGIALRYTTNVNPVDEQGRTPLALVSRILKSPNLVGDWRTHGESKRVLLLDRGGRMDGLVADAILVTRESMASVRSVVRRDPAGWNRFTLHDVVAMAYGMCARPEVPKRAAVLVRGQSRFSAVPQPISSPQNDPDLTWPDLTNIVVRRLVSTNLAGLKPGEERREIKPRFENIELEWGDIVEIPEADHPLNQGWNDYVLRNLLGSTMPRDIRVNSAGKETVVKLGWGRSFPANYSVGRALDDSGLLLKSSNLSAVKIVSGNAKPGGGVVPYLVLDLNESMLKYNLWVRDGDRIEVP